MRDYKKKKVSCNTFHAIIAAFMRADEVDLVFH